MMACLNPAKRCMACGLDYAFIDSGDGPAVFVILILGFVIAGLALVVETAFEPPLWLHAIVWIPVVDRRIDLVAAGDEGFHDRAAIQDEGTRGPAGLSALSRFILIVCVLAATAVLACLGAWQVQRLQWKEALIADVTARVKSPPSTLPEMAVQYAETGDVDYAPVSLSGTFDHSREMYFFTTHDGQSGWSVFTPLVLDSGNVALVNRGFVPAQLRDPALRPARTVGREGHDHRSGA